MKSNGLSFHHPVSFWLGCVAIVAGVLAHVPMFIHASLMDYRMVGMPMDPAMLAGMVVIPIGLLPSRRGCCHPRPSQTRTCRFPAFGSSGESFAHSSVAMDNPDWR